MKKVINLLIILILLIFSIFYTIKVNNKIKKSNSIYKKILENSNIEPKDAIIKNNTIIPGIKGKKIDINKSYYKMKRKNKYDENLLVYKEIEPEIKVKNNKDKIIISGNDNIYLLFILKDNVDLDKLLRILNSYNIKGNFYFNDYFNKYTYKILHNNHKIGLLKQSNNYLIKIINKNIYYYCENLCNFKNGYIIKPNLIVKNNYFINVKNNIRKGMIIALYLNKLDELSLILDYLKIKGYNIETIDKLVE